MHAAMAEAVAGRLWKIIAVALVLSSLDFQLVSCIFCLCVPRGCCECDENILRDCECEDIQDCMHIDGRRCLCNETECLEDANRCQDCHLPRRGNLINCIKENCDCNEENDDNDEDDDEENCKDDGVNCEDYVKVIVIPTCITVTLLMAMAVCAVIVALYWKFKIKLVREMRNANPSQAKVVEDPLYSVLGGQVTPGYIREPPQLPPSRVPYYEEIESDRIGAAAKSPQDIPMTSLSPKHGKDNSEMEAIEPYQEPADAKRSLQ